MNKLKGWLEQAGCSLVDFLQYNHVIVTAGPHDEAERMDGTGWLQSGRLLTV